MLEVVVEEEDEPSAIKHQTKVIYIYTNLNQTVFILLTFLCMNSLMH